MGELSGQAREAWVERGARIFRATGGHAEDAADAALAAPLGDGRSVAEHLDDGAIALAALMDGPEHRPIGYDGPRKLDCAVCGGRWPCAASALLARLGSGGGVPDGEGDET